MKRFVLFCIFLVFILCSCSIATTEIIEPTLTEKLAIPILNDFKVNTSAEIAPDTDALSSDDRSPSWLHKYGLEYYKEYLGIDTLELIKDNDGSVEYIKDIEIRFNKCNFSKKDINYWGDLLLEIIVDTGWDKTDFVAFCAFELCPNDNGNSYNLLFAAKTHLPSIRCLDLNGDFINEVIIEESFIGDAARSAVYSDVYFYERVHIYARVDDSYDIIFNEPITERRMFATYAYDNTYTFFKDDNTSEWYDILLESITYDDPQDGSRSPLYSVEKERGTTLFKFDGKKYNASGEVFDYRKGFDLALN